MKPPRFWYHQPDRFELRSTLLAPLGALYGRATKRRVAREPKLRLSIPVISIGNINVGGTGKTPMAIYAALSLMARNRQPHMVLRGYGGQIKGPMRVDPQQHTAHLVGDEALLLSAFAPTWVGRERALAGQSAAQGADALVLDDAHQNPDIAKSANILVIDAQIGFGNGQCLPAGPLREPVSAGLERADLVIIIGNDADTARFEKQWRRRINQPICHASLSAIDTGMEWHGSDVLAFAGIGRPEKFFETLRELGANVKQTHALADHQPLSPTMMARLEREARDLGAQLVTTEKDAARLPRAWRSRVLSLPVRLVLKDPSPWENLLDRLGL